MKNSNKKGFTLVELVVVIAIIGVLAAILVPSLMGYVKKSRLKTANGNAKTAYNAVAEVDADCETQGFPIDWTDFTVDTFSCTEDPGDRPTLSSDNVADVMTYEVRRALATNGNEAGQVYVGHNEFNGVNAPFVQWQKTDTDDMFGQYPEALQSVEEAEDNEFGSFVSHE